MTENTSLYHFIGIVILAIALIMTLMGNIMNIPVLSAAGGVVMLVGFLLVWKFGPKKQNDLEVLKESSKDMK